MTLVLEVDGLWKSYHVGVRGCSARISVLCGIHLQLRRGERVGIVGRPGSGKTTLMHCLAGLRRPDQGRICLPGGPVSLALLDGETPVGPGYRAGAGAVVVVARELALLRDDVDRLLLLRDGRLAPLDPPLVAVTATRRVAEPGGEGREVHELR